MNADVDDFLAAVASSASLNVLSQHMVQRQIDEAPHLASDEAIFDLLTVSTTANAAAVLQILRPGPFQGRVATPTEALSIARQLVQIGIPMSDLLRAYRIGHNEFQRRMSRLIAAATSDADLISSAEMHLSAVCFSYVDRVSEHIAAIYPSGQDRVAANQVEARSALVDSILAGETVDIAEAEKMLAYPLQEAHLGVVVWTDDPKWSVDRQSRLAAVVTALADQLGCAQPPLSIAPDDSTLWAWLPYLNLEAPTADAITEPADGSVRIALGEPGVGVDGFRLTNKQARQAQIVSLAAGEHRRQHVISSADIGVLGLFSGDIVTLRQWVQHILDDLSADNPNTKQLRETLWVFITSGASHTVAGEKLHLHKNTVKYRVAKAEQLCGRSVRSARLDMEVALLACHLLGPAVLRTTTPAR